MPIKFTCPHCATVMNVADAAAGKAGKCKGCGGKVVVPASSEAAHSPLPSEAPPTKPASPAKSSSPPPRPRNNSSSSLPSPHRIEPTTSAPTGSAADSYGAIFDRVEAATGGSGNDVHNAEVVEGYGVDWNSTPFNFQTGSSGTAHQTATGRSYASRSRGPSKHQRSQQLKSCLALGAVGVFLLLFSTGLFVLEPEYPPVPVNMAALDAGKLPTQKYVELGPHIACYYAGVCTMRKKDEHKPNPMLEKFSYPIISTSHPAAEELLALFDKHGSFVLLPDDVIIPPLEHVSAIVTTEEYRYVTDVPIGPVRIERLTGTQGLGIPHRGQLEESCEMSSGGLRGKLEVKAHDKPLFRSTGTVIGGFLCSGISLLMFGLSFTAGYRWLTKAS